MEFHDISRSSKFPGWVATLSNGLIFNNVWCSSRIDQGFQVSRNSDFFFKLACSFRFRFIFEGKHTIPEKLPDRVSFPQLRCHSLRELRRWQREDPYSQRDHQVQVYWWIHQEPFRFLHPRTAVRLGSSHHPWYKSQEAYRNRASIIAHDDTFPAKCQHQLSQIPEKKENFQCSLDNLTVLKIVVSRPSLLKVRASQRLDYSAL